MLCYSDLEAIVAEINQRYRSELGTTQNFCTHMTVKSGELHMLTARLAPRCVIVGGKSHMCIQKIVNNFLKTFSARRIFEIDLSEVKLKTKPTRVYTAAEFTPEILITCMLEWVKIVALDTITSQNWRSLTIINLRCGHTILR